MAYEKERLQRSLAILPQPNTTKSRTFGRNIPALLLIPIRDKPSQHRDQLHPRSHLGMQCLA